MGRDLTGRVAIVTGASRGLGAAIAAALLADGASVVAAARNVDALRELGAAHADRVAVAAYDARDPSAAERLAADALAAFGRLDVLVNNAGVAPASRFLEDSDELWRDVLEVNVLAPVALTRAVGRHLVRQGAGKVINIASLTGMRGKAWLGAYSASKGALVRFTEAIAAEWAASGVQVNAVAPGAFRTEAQQEVLGSEGLYQRRVAKIPAGRFGEMHEIGPLVCYLASSDSDFVSGATFVIDGGELGRL